MSLKVLIVDDDDVVLFLHRVMVQQSTLCSDPLTFLNAKKILEYLQEQHEKEDQFLILLDINMPLMDGWQLLDSIQKEPFADKVAVIMVTSSVNNYDKEKANEYSQVIQFIEKPLSIEICTSFKAIDVLQNHF